MMRLNITVVFGQIRVFARVARLFQFASFFCADKSRQTETNNNITNFFKLTVLHIEPVCQEGKTRKINKRNGIISKAVLRLPMILA